MHVRRALLLFAIVLGVAALAASLSSRPDDQPERAPAPTTDTQALLRPGPETRRPAEVSFRAGKRRGTKRLRAGRAAVVTVRVRKAGQVELEGLGLTAPATALTPARFDVLATDPGDHEVRFTPAGGAESTLVGTLKITQASR